MDLARLCLIAYLDDCDEGDLIGISSQKGDQGKAAPNPIVY